MTSQEDPWSRAFADMFFFSEFFAKGRPLPRGAEFTDNSAEGYTRRLVRRVLLEPDRMFDDVDMVEEYKKVYGPDIVLVSDPDDIPDGWILIDGQSATSAASNSFTSDPNPPPKTIIKKRWDRLDDEDPNWRENMKRARVGEGPIDKWDMGYEYEYTSRTIRAQF